MECLQLPVVIYSCSFFLRLPLKNWPCWSANLILESRPVFIRSVVNLRPSSFIPILGCFYIVRQCEVSPVEVSNVRHSSYSRFSHVRHCSPKVQVAQSNIFVLLQATMFLVSVDSDTTNQKSTSTTTTRTKQIESARTKRQFHAALTPLPRRDDAPHAVLTPLSRRFLAAVTPLTPVPRSTHAAVTRLPRRIAAVMTPLPRRADPPFTPR